MSEQVTRILIIVAIILILLAAWLGTIVFISRDTTRRNMSGWQRFTWLVLALVPLVGFMAYLFVRQLEAPAASMPAGQAGAERARPGRLTFFKPPPRGAPRRLPTIPAADYLRADPVNPTSDRAGRRPASARGTGQAPEPAGEPDSYVLSAVEGPHVGQEFGLDRLPAVIGRGQECRVRLDNDLSVSRRHAEVYRQAGRLRLRDLGSTHGTLLNGQRVTDQALRPGDQIRVGYTLLRLDG